MKPTLTLLSLCLALSGCKDSVPSAPKIPGPDYKSQEQESLKQLKEAQHQAYIACFETGVLCCDHVVLTNYLAGHAFLTSEQLLKAASELNESTPSLIKRGQLK